MNHIHNKSKHNKAHGLQPVGTLNPRSGFTLVEMLVSVALVVLMMAMFASVFEMAADSVGTQRGIAENDQRARSVTIVMRNDILARNMKIVLPFTPGELPPNPGDADFDQRDFTRRRGYFSVSENDINNDTDDVLQFTVELDGTNREYYGRAALLGDVPALTRAQFQSSNQPSRDDGDPNRFDNASNSIAAEISYFLRGGRLYRRVLLIRSPLESGDPVQPETANGVNYFDPLNDGTMGTPSLYSGNFWNNFDFSAHSTLAFDMMGMVTSENGVVFHGIDDLNNEALSGLFPIANPRNRFGHNHVTGRPREYVSSRFIGRFTHEETSHSAFQYPQWASTVGMPGNPMDPTLVLNDADNNDVIDEFEVLPRGPRRAEDLLLSNVHAFDVKLWDDQLGRFVDVGHNIGSSGGRFRRNGPGHTNTNYGPSGATTRRMFDTWHPDIDIDSTPGTPDQPPFSLRDSSGNNPQPLRAIQITIRYFDVSSSQLRQLTLQVALTDDE